MIKVTRRAGFSLLFMLPFSGTAAARMARRNTATPPPATPGEGHTSCALGQPQATLSALRAANITDRFFLYDAALWTWTTGDYTGQTDDSRVVKADGAPLSAGAWIRQTAEGVTYKADARGTRARSVSNKLDETALSVMDFMTPEQANSVRQRQSIMDCTDAINAAFVHAQNTGRTVYFPDGVYLVGNLIFGTQSETGGSSTPLGLQGQSKIGTVLRAKPGLTGTLLKSRSCAGVTFSDFTIETIGTAAQAWDCAWKAGAGPSTQNVIQNILVTGGTALLHVDWNDLNDTYPTGVTVRVDDPTARSCGISAVQSGGLSAMHGCIWSGCYLRFGSQNGKIDTCWGHGIEFATGCLNYIEISACYIYANSTHGALLWSQSFASYQSIRALTCTATQFITLVSAVPAYFNINAYSAIRFIGCQWIGSTGNMFGKDCRTDSYSKVLVKIDGGAHTGNLLLQDSSGFDIECEGFMNDSTGRMVTKTRSGIFTPIVRGGSRGVKYIGGREIYGRYHRQGNIIFFKLRIQWSRYTELVKTEPLQITGFPLEVDSLGASSVSIEYWGGNHLGEIRPTFSDGVVNLFSVDGSPVAMSSNGDIILSGFYSIKA